MRKDQVACFVLCFCLINFICGDYRWTIVTLRPYSIWMKNKLHLIYGITMGILLCACVGVNSKTKSLSEVHCIYWKSGEWKAVGTYEKEEYKPDLPAYPTPYALARAGWTIIDMEFGVGEADLGVGYVMIGK